jgi:hypothetical protein
MMGNVRADGGKFRVLGAGLYQIVGAMRQIERFFAGVHLWRCWFFGLKIRVGGDGQSCLVFTGVEDPRTQLNYPV